jgi:hypothetical protein
MKECSFIVFTYYLGEPLQPHLPRPYMANILFEVGEVSSPRAFHCILGKDARYLPSHASLAWTVGITHRST